jgi:hypothetical protein
MKYKEGQWRPQGGSTTPSGVAIVPVGLDTGPSIVRIPASAGGGSSMALTSVNVSGK